MALASAVMAAAYAPASLSHTTACTARFEDSLRGGLHPTRSPLDIEEFTLHCAGSIQASLRVTHGRSTWIRAELAVNQDGTWQTVDHGHSIVFRAKPGRYRYRLWHTGPEGAEPQWQLTWSKPR